ncbi:hypothetical protein B0H12DRAFT_1144950, partial [Mycena haematopus]
MTCSEACGVLKGSAPADGAVEGPFSALSRARPRWCLPLGTVYIPTGQVSMSSNVPFMLLTAVYPPRRAASEQGGTGAYTSTGIVCSLHHM